MKNRAVLIVDDQKNIRLTLSEALLSLGVEVDAASSGEEGLTKVKEREFSLILLDLKMPGMDGMEVLRRVREIRPDIRIIIITAYGTIESAVEAMKLGASDFIQKPFTPEEIRELVTRVMNREKIDADKAKDYSTSIELAKRCIGDYHFDAAVEHVHRAIFFDPGRPEAFNLLGALEEIRGNRLNAQNHYRAALSLDPSYKPAMANLERATSAIGKRTGGIDLGKSDEEKEGPPASPTPFPPSGGRK
jgi:DNA-binding response OmpR family regulator